MGLHVYSRSKQLLQVSSSHSGLKGSHRIRGSSTTERYEMTVPVSLQCEESRLQRQDTTVGSLTHTNTRDSVHSNLNTAAYAYLRYAFLFFIALLVTWVCSFLPFHNNLRGRANNSFTGSIFGKPPIYTNQSQLRKFWAPIYCLLCYSAARILEQPYFFQYLSARVQSSLYRHP